MVRAYDAIVFDLDDTLVDSAPSIAHSVNTVLREEGRGPLPLEAVRAMIGDGSLKLMERALSAVGLPVDDADFVRRRTSVLFTLLVRHPPGPDRLYPGVRETLDRLAGDGCRLAICSNKPADATAQTLRVLGLTALFGAVIGGDSLPQRKPDAEPVLAALRLLDKPRDSAVMVGDSGNDVAAAKAAGLPSVLVSYGYARQPVRSLGADRIVDRFADLPAALDDLRAAAA